MSTNTNSSNNDYSQYYSNNDNSITSSNNDYTH